jgi:hypothetical protein
LKWITEKSTEKLLEVTGIKLIGAKVKIIIIPLCRLVNNALQDYAFVNLI